MATGSWGFPSDACNHKPRRVKGPGPEFNQGSG